MGAVEERTKTIRVLTTAIHQAITGVQRGGYTLDLGIVDKALTSAEWRWADDYFSRRDGEPQDTGKDDILGSTN